jgi:hypothetical protein
MIEQILCILKSFQTLIVGTIGFVGVVYTIYKNAQIARKQTEAIRSHERDAFRLIEELALRLKVLSAQSDEGALYEGYIYIGKEHVKNAGKMHENFLKSINEALNAIKI